MKKLRITLIMTAICLLMASLPTNFTYGGTKTKIDDPSTVPVVANGAAVIDAKTGNVLYSKDGNERFYPASTTKVLAVITAIENGKLDSKITVSYNAVHNIDKDSSHISLQVGEEITVEEALYGMMMASGNDASVAVAEGISGSVEKYSDLMNATAKKAGCTNSHFSNPHGLYADDHYTTPIDMAKIMRYAIQNKDFLRIDKTLHYTLAATNMSPARELWNNHRMIENKYLYYAPVVCGKSGFIDKSKFNLVTYGQKNGIELIVVAYGGESPDVVCNDTKALMEYYFNNYKSGNAKVKDIGKVTVEGKKTSVSYKEDFPILLPNDSDISKVTYEPVIDKLELPIKKGTKVGTLNAICKDKVVGVTEIYAKKDIITTGAFIARVGIIGLLTLVLLFLLLLLRKRLRRKVTSRK